MTMLTCQVLSPYGEIDSPTLCVIAPHLANLVMRNAGQDRRRSEWWKWWRAAPTAHVEMLERPPVCLTLEGYGALR